MTVDSAAPKSVAIDFLPEEGCDEYVRIWEERTRLALGPARVLAPD